MTANNSINISGLIKNMLDSGFDTTDCLGELIDNSLGAKATNIKIHFIDDFKYYQDDINKTNYVILFADNGIGMNKNELDNCYILHNRQTANDERSGYFGIGSKHAKIHFTQYKHTSRTISKKVDTNLAEIEADWEAAVNNNEYNPKSHQITLDGNNIWNEYNINNNYGTIDIIPCNKSIYESIILNINNIVQKYGRMYYQNIKECTLSLYINEKENCKEYIVKSLDPLEWDNIGDDYKQIKTLDVRINKDNKIFVFFKNNKKNSEIVFYDEIDKKEKIMDKYEENTIKKGTIIIISTYNKEWKNHDNSKILGGRYIQRTNKIIDHFEIPFPTSGDFDKREFIAYSRHLINFTHVLDKEFQVQINKSHIKENDINHHIYESIKYLNKKFSEDIYKKHSTELKPVVLKPKPVEPEPVKPKQVEPKPVEPKQVVQQSKQLKLKCEYNKIILYENNYELLVLKTSHSNKLISFFNDNLKNLKNDTFIKFFDEYIKLSNRYNIN